MIKKNGDIQHQNFLKLIEGNNGLTFTDTHAHIHFKPLSDDVEGLLSACRKNKVDKIFTVGINYDDSIEAVRLAEKHENIYAVAGVHPHDSEEFNFNNLGKFEELFVHEKVIGIGEIGLDFYRNHSTPERQEEVFLTFLDLAVTHKMPVIIHNRDATKRCVEVLNSMVAKRGNNGIIHCFNGDKDMLKWALDNGFYISFAGPLTYNKAVELHETVKYVPLDRLLVETDCPYLAPVPFRGKTNEPANVIYTALMMSELLNVDIFKLTGILEQNTQSLFGNKL